MLSNEVKSKREKKNPAEQEARYICIATQSLTIDRDDKYFVTMSEASNNRLRIRNRIFNKCPLHLRWSKKERRECEDRSVKNSERKPEPD